MKCLRLAASLLVTTALLFTPTQSVLAAGPSSEEKLSRALKDPSFKVRLQAAILIGKKKVLGAIPALRDALDDEQDAVRAAAAVSLGKLGDEQSRSRLAALMGHKNELVVQAAESALISLDRVKGGPAYLVVVEQPGVPKGVARSRGARLLRIFRTKLKKTGGIVLSAGEERILGGAELAAHLAKRKVTGIVLHPKIASLNESVGEGKTTLLCKVSVMVATLIRKRIEFSAGGEADAWIEDTDISDADRGDLQNTVLDAASDAAIQQAIEYLARREAY